MEALSHNQYIRTVGYHADVALESVALQNFFNTAVVIIFTNQIFKSLLYEIFSQLLNAPMIIFMLF